MQKKRTQNLSIAQQAFYLSSKFPKFKVKCQPGTLRCYGIIHPTPSSIIYKFKLRYSLKKPPDVWITCPELIARENEKKIPHTYSGKRLCLYKPGNGEFTKKDFLADTIIPWTSLWLYYYEIWYITGEWLGGGEHPTNSEEE